MDQPKIEKLLRLVQLLINNRRNTQELAMTLGCNVRTVQRYINHLRNAHFIIESTKKGVYFLRKDQGALKNLGDLLHFSEEEALILHKAIDSIDGNTLLKQNLKKKLYNIYNYVELADVIVHPEQGEVVQNLISAIHARVCVELVDYRSSHSNKVSTRYVEPFDFTVNYEQVWCYEHASGRSKLFKVSRIGRVVVHHNKPWLYEKEHIAPKTDIFRIAGDEYIGKARLTLNMRAYNLLIEEYPLAEKFITRKKENEYLLNAPLCSYEGVGRFVMGLFDNIEVQGDKGLIRFLNKKISGLKKITTETVV